MQNSATVMPKDIQEKFLGCSIEEVVFELARKGDVKGLKDFLSLMADIDARDARCRTALMRIPCNQGIEQYKELVDLFVEHGADINAQCKDGSTMLFGAVAGMYKEQVQYLIDLGANPNIQNIHGQTAPMEAIYWENRQQIVRVLCEAGYSVDLRCKGGKTALMVAASQGDIANVQTLLWYGADSKLKDDEGRTAREVSVSGSVYQELLLAEKAILPTREAPERHLKVAGLDRA